VSFVIFLKRRVLTLFHRLAKSANLTGM
jgi:hypothetical protein